MDEVSGVFPVSKLTTSFDHGKKFT